MRINVYSQELTSEVSIVEKQADTGIIYSGIRLMLHSSPLLHNTVLDDDRSAITIWLPKSRDRRVRLAATLESMAVLIRGAKRETGDD